MRADDADRARLSALVAAVREHQALIETYAERAARIGEMEAALIDSKIVARIEGLLAGSAPAGDAVAAAESHVEGVLRPSEFDRMLERSARFLEEEIEERKVTSHAKAILESEYGMTEEQAHLHLRSMSRKSRKPLKEVAQELIEARNSLWASQL